MGTRRIIPVQKKKGIISKRTSTIAGLSTEVPAICGLGDDSADPCLLLNHSARTDAKATIRLTIPVTWI
jgi:hypothetical protein